MTDTMAQISACIGLYLEDILKWSDNLFLKPSAAVIVIEIGECQVDKDLFVHHRSLSGSSSLITLWTSI